MWKNAKLSLIISAVLVFIPHLFLIIFLPIGRDSGVYMYTGVVMNNGGMPYVDAWDHKGPALYLLNALGIFLVGDVRGVILLEATLLFGALAFSIYVWRRMLSWSWVYILASSVAITYYGFFENGNMTETWSFPFLLFAYSLTAFRIVKAGVNHSEPYLMKLFSAPAFSGSLLSLSTAVVLMTRPNNAIGLIVVCLYSFFWTTDRTWRTFVSYVLPGTSLIITIVIWLQAGNAFHAFVDQFFVYNKSYSSNASLSDRFSSVHSLIKSFLFSPLAVICFVSFVFLSFVEIEEGSYIRSVNRAFFVFFLIFILDLSSQTVSGSAYSHYLLIGIPALMVTLALAFVQFSYSAENIQLKRFHIGICFVAVFLAAVSMRGVYFVYQASVNGLAVRTSYQHELVNYVRSNSSSSEYVLVHGAETWILVGSERRSPTSISYIYPALQRFQSVYEKYIREIVAHKPVLIVETPLSCGLYLRSCSRQNDFLELKLFVDEYYSFAKEIHGYRIWRLNSTL